MKRTLVFILAISISLASFASNSTDHEVSKSDSTFALNSDDAVLEMIDSIMAQKYYRSFSFMEDTLGIFPMDSVLALNDSIIELRLKVLNDQSPFDLRYNEHTKAFINLYVNKKRDLSRSVLGLAPRYFPMFEETLDEFQMPLELKYLAVVESALSPSARSRVGAQGLWQFMYRTGKMYGLNVTSYYDERMDPYKATRAACQYMSDLYKLYGDWSLVLAAYNSGPGNVNKAIRRSGGVKDYWKIRRYLPRETRGYVPAFIAVNYMMSYPEEHNLYPKEVNSCLFDTDTIYLSRAMSFDRISSYLDISQEEIAFYNPQYKHAFIPKTNKAMPLCLPTELIGIYLNNERAIFADIRKKEIADSLAGIEVQPDLPPSITHYVRSGEFLGYIAEKHHVSVRSLMEWNNLYSTRINPGDKLIIYTKAGQPPVKPTTVVAKAEPQKSNTPTDVSEKGKYQFHTVKRGDTLWDIAKYYENTTVNDLKRLNSGINFRRLKPGMQVKVKEIG